MHVRSTSCVQGVVFLDVKSLYTNITQNLPKSNSAKKVTTTFLALTLTLNEKDTFADVVQNVIFKSFAKFTGKHLTSESFFNKEAKDYKCLLFV